MRPGNQPTSAIVKELWDQAVLYYNLPLTILLALMVGFWILTLLGAATSHSLDVDLDAHADLDADADIDGDPNIGDIPAAMLRVVNAGYIPLTIVLSILILAMWLISITLNYYFNPGHTVALAVGFFFSAFILGVIFTKLITQPLVPFMRRLKEAENTAPVIGEVGVVRSIEMDSTYGQVEVQRPNGAPALLNARLSISAEPVFRGTEVAIVSMDEKTGIYLASALPKTPSID